MNSLQGNPFSAPLPQSGVGVGKVGASIFAAPNAAVLPAGGAYEYLIHGFNRSSGGWIGVFGRSVAAGGTTIIAGNPSYNYTMGYWEIMGPGSFDPSGEIIQRKDGSYEITKLNGRKKYRFHVLSIELADKHGLNPADAMAAHPDCDEESVTRFYREVTELYDEVSAYVAAHPEAITPEPTPEPPKSDPDQQVAQEIMVELIEERRRLKKWRDRRSQLQKGGQA